MDCEGDGITLSKRHDVHAALHARPLFGQDKLTTGEIPPRLGQQNGHLDWESEFAI